MSVPLPRQLSVDSFDEIRAIVRQFVDYLVSIPKFEIRTAEVATTNYHILKTSIKRPKGLLLVQAYQTASPDTTVSFGALPDWRLVPDGIKVRVDTSEVLHTFTYLVIGD